MNPEGRAIWNGYLRVITAAGMTARINEHQLLRIVALTQEHQRATALLAQTDILIDADGTPKPSPALDVQERTGRQLADLERRLGLNRLTPLHTGQLHVPPEQLKPPKLGRWCEEHKRHECTAMRSRGRGICHGPAVAGYARCKQHVGKRLATDPVHLNAIAQRANPLAGEPMDIGPAEALLWRVRVLSGEVARLDELIGSLEAEELVWGKLTEEENDSGEFPGKKTVKGARMSVWLTLREQRERALHSACEAALRANIEERLVRLAETQGAVMHKVILAALADFGIRSDDPRIPLVLPGRIRQLTMGEVA